MLDALRWLITVELIGLAAFPLAFYLLPRLADRGFTLSRPLGILLVSYLFWLLGLAHIPTVQPIAIALVLLMAALSVYIAYRNFDGLRGLHHARVAHPRHSRGNLPRLLHRLDALPFLRPLHQPHRAADGPRPAKRLHQLAGRASRRPLAARRADQLLLLRLLDDGRAQPDFRHPVPHLLQPCHRAHPRDVGNGHLRHRLQHGAHGQGAHRCRWHRQYEYG